MTLATKQSRKAGVSLLFFIHVIVSLLRFGSAFTTTISTTRNNHLYHIHEQQPSPSLLKLQLSPPLTVLQRRNQNNNHCFHHSQLASSSKNVENKDNKKDNGSSKNFTTNNKKRRLRISLSSIPNSFSAMRQFLQTFRRYFMALSNKAKVFVTIRLACLFIILGLCGRNVVNRVSGDSSAMMLSRRAAIERPVEVPYSAFLDLVEQSGQGHKVGKNPAIQLSDIAIGNSRIGFRIDQDTPKHEVALRNPKLVQSEDVSTRTVKPQLGYTKKLYASPDLINFLRDNDVPFTAASNRRANVVANTARSSILLIYILFLGKMYRSMGGGGGDLNDIPGKLARKRRNKKNSADKEQQISFNDIEGIDDAKFEVMELVDALRNPGKYAVLGARAPTGLLLEGPPGTGKTMLARACAATTGVPLISCSGSDFVEMFVGRGAGRVRRTFKQAGKIAPCIIFIDELDALGKARESGDFAKMTGMRGNDEADRTLTQLLACMDGLDSSQGICVLAATNRKEILDEALVRPGRFDRIVKVRLPDVDGRERILRVHAKKLPSFKECKGVDNNRIGSLGKGNSVDLSAVAAVTPGLSGAELEFIVNEASIRTVRRVSSALREGQDPDKITAQVTANDFELSVKNYYDTRRGGSGGKMSEVFNNVMRPRVT